MRRRSGSLTSFAALVTAVVLSLVLALAGCSGGDEDEPESERPPAGAPSERGVPSRVEVGEVAGRLDKGPAREVAAEVAEVVDRWLDAAYVAGDYPRSDFRGAFPGFTQGAARLAARQGHLMSNGRVGEDLEGVVATRRVIRVDLLAPRGEAAGATAHVNLVMDLTGRVERTDEVRGRVMLSRSKKGWQVFGFDIARGEVRGR